jgi:hypothetical protein
LNFSTMSVSVVESATVALRRAAAFATASTGVMNLATG